MLRFSLGALLLFVFFAALGCAALVYSNDVWRQIVVTLSTASLLFATVFAVVRREQKQAFAVGFALVGWIYLVSVFTPIVDIKNHLLTTQVLVWLGKAMQVNDQVSSGQVLVDFDSDGQGFVFSAAGSQLNTTGAVLRLARTPQSAAQANFIVIGHSLWTLILACVGGALARILSRHEDRQTKGVT